MIRRPPRSTLFPYTTSSDLKLTMFQAALIEMRTVFCFIAPEMAGRGTVRASGLAVSETSIARQHFLRARRCAMPHPSEARSEEHTSELQSRRDLVCRLLLEK